MDILEYLCLVWYIVYSGYIRIPDSGPILRAHGLDCGSFPSSRCSCLDVALVDQLRLWA